MILHLDTTSSEPIFEQIVRQVKNAVARGACVPGDQLPSVRQLAIANLVNPNTVAKAYRELEREGAIRTRRGLGVFVAEGAPKLCARDGRATAEDLFDNAICQAIRAGLPHAEIARLFRQTLARHAPKPKDPGR